MRIELLTSVIKSDSAARTPQASKPEFDVAMTGSATEPQHAAPQSSAVEAAAKQIEAYLERAGRSLEFRVDTDTHRTVVTVRDTASGEVIRQIPSEEVLHLARQLGAGSGGLVALKV
jgi:flagellar protein FlaG